jgi:hypothetical protein
MSSMCTEEFFTWHEDAIDFRSSLIFCVIGFGLCIGNSSGAGRQSCVRWCGDTFWELCAMSNNAKFFATSDV